MTLTDILQSIALLITMVGGIIGFISTAKKSRKELTKSDTDIGQISIDNTVDALALVREATKQVKEAKDELNSSCEKYEKEILVLRNEMRQMKAEYEAQIKILQEEAKIREERLETVEDWASRLVHQVQSLGADPVLIKTIKKEK